jgi:pectate lyase
VSRAPSLTSAVCALTVAGAACGEARLHAYKNRPDCPDVLVGYAAVGGTDADGGTLQPTTGGGDAASVTVTNVDDLTMELQRPEPRVIFLSGVLSPAATIKVTTDKSMPGGNKTLLGVGDGSGLTGAGLDLSYADNIILRNLKISKVSIGEGDAVTLLASHHVWVDHCDLSSERNGTASYDGLVDITHGSSYVTVSWTLFHDHRDTSLVGHSADMAQMTEDSALSVTYHHNLFSNIETGPRVRWGTAHVFSNHFQNVGIFGVASESLAAVLVDHNLFEDFDADAVPVTTTYMDTLAGTMTETSNKFPAGFTPNIVPISPPRNLPYGYSSDAAESVATIVSACAGTGKINFQP